MRIWELVGKSELEIKIWGSSARRLRLNPGEYVLNYVHYNRVISAPKGDQEWEVCKSTTSQLLAKSGIFCIWMSAQHLQRQKLASSGLYSESPASLSGPVCISITTALSQHQQLVTPTKGVKWKDACLSMRTPTKCDQGLSSG